MSESPVLHTEDARVQSSPVQSLPPDGIPLLESSNYVTPTAPFYMVPLHTRGCRHCHTITCMRVNAIRTILQLTLATHGHLLGVKLATRGTYIPIVTHNILIIIVLLCRCGPYMCMYIFPSSIWRVPYLSWNQKLLQMQEYTHILIHGGERSIWLHHPCLLGVPMVGRDQYGYISRAFSGFPWWREINIATSPLPSQGPHGGERSKWLHHPCLLGVPVVGRNQPRNEWMWWK